MQLGLIGLIIRILHLHLLRVFTAHHAGGHLADLCKVAGSVTLSDLCATFLDLLAGAIVDLYVRLELEEEVAAVNDEEQDTGASGQRCDFIRVTCGIFIDISFC